MIRQERKGQAMALSSLTCIFIIIPLTVVLYRLVPVRARMALLLAVSLLFYAWGGPKYVLFLLLSTAFDYFAVLEIADFRSRRLHRAARRSLLLAVGVHVAALCVFKYTALAMPVGISFYTFSSISVLIDVYRGEAEAETNPLYLALYIAFFPKITSGPIVRWRDMEDVMKAPVITVEDTGQGVRLFFMGLFKKVLIADSLGRAFASVGALPEMAAVTAILGMIFYSLQLYFDFSGYSDMAIGLSRLFGFRFAENFHYPYLSGSVTEFWRRWHISLGAFFRDYVYIPLGGNRCSIQAQIRNLLVVWALTGIWHGSTLNFLFWGLYHGFFILLERFVLKGRQEALPPPVRILFTDIIAFVGWVFFFSPSLGSAFAYLGKMIGTDGLGFWNGMTTFLLRENALLLLTAVLLCGPWIRNLHDSLVYREGGAWRTASQVLFVVLTICSVAALVSATYTSFLYFQF